MKVHIRHNGKSETFETGDRGINSKMDDQEIKRLLSQFYEIPSKDLRNIIIDRNPDGIVVRPPAVFG